MFQKTLELAEHLLRQFLERYPAPAEGIERIQVFEQAQMIVDELVLHDIVYS